ncbi:MAG: excinuclease ABC subunit UvrA [Bacteroidales bacterium]|jgi:excinuclease ABC subunit A|nr:excinuclease ABC subunit UvrA [Bacteroidales bacterium]
MNSPEHLEILGAKAHNLQNIDLIIPRDQLVVITGLSGSGKSSLAFDTIYAEGQRRYMETFSAYARQFIGNLERPEVDKINGLSPVISIEQKTVGRNPRSTVGTITEIYDFLRLLYARVADAYSYDTGEKMVKYTEAQITDLILDTYNGKDIIILAPMIKGRKGHYRENFEQMNRLGFLKARVDGKIVNIEPGMMLDRYKTHDIDMVIDKIAVNLGNKTRIAQSVQTAMKHGKGVISVLDVAADVNKLFSKHLMCPTTGISYSEPEPNTFSFNSPYGACPRCNGLGVVTEIDMQKVIPNNKLNIRQGGITPIGEYKNNWIFNKIETIGKRYKFTLDTPIKNISEDAMKALLYGTDEVVHMKNDYLGVTTKLDLEFEGIISFIRSHQHEENAVIQKWVSNFTNQVECPLCHGTRLKRESLQFKIYDKNIAELANMDLVQLHDWMHEIDKKIEPRKQKIAYEIIREIRTRIGFLLDVGIEYLTLNRSAGSLSGGESQRIRLATQIGSKLVGVLYILDEPSIGLHQRDNLRLIKALKELRDVGNSVIVVEHDKDMILAADHVIDMGPGAGINGGKVVFQGKIDLCAGGEGRGARSASRTPRTSYLEPRTESLTLDYLTGKKSIEIPQQRRKGNGKTLVLKGATGHNLKNVTLELPLGMMVCVTGVSGSGKSSLINETLHPILSKHFYRSEQKPLPYKSIEGLENIDKVIEIDQSPIGRTPRSNPATYIGVFDDIRKLYASLPDAKIRGYLPGRFSFNVKGGRCEECGGAGVKVIEMNFLPPVHVHCEVCNGKRYNRETLEVRYKGRSINDVLNMNIDQAVEFFEHIPHILHRIKTLQDVGLGYITLGQQSTTLSGGEAQRVKLAAELSKKDTGKTLYILDEPTTGLHFEDVNVLMGVLNKLVNKGNTVLVIEHNMDVIKLADYIIDIGPEGGEAGGKILAAGTPEEIVKLKDSYTGFYLKDCL